MTQTTIGPDADLFPDLRREPIRNFTETGWGRFPAALIDAGLHPHSFTVYAFLSFWADTGTAPDVQALKDGIKTLSVDQIETSVAALERKNMLKRENSKWILTDPDAWTK